MNVSEQFPQLLKATVFEGVGKTDAKYLLDQGQLKSYRRPTIVLREGELANNVFMVANGTLDIYYDGLTDTKMLLHRARVGEIVGELELLSDMPCAATCETNRDTSLVIFSKDLVAEFFRTDVILRNMAAILHTRLERSNKFRVVDNCFPSRQRLCAYLLYLRGRDDVVTDNQKFLADLIGCTRQTINRELGSLRDEGVLVISGRTIQIVDVARLTELSGIVESKAP